MVSVSGMGVTGLTWSEIESWAKLSGMQLEYWEFEVIKELSDAYAAMLRAAKDWDCKPVFDPISTAAFDQKEHSRRMREASRAMR